MTNYQRGFKLEHEAKRTLEKEGWTVFRSAGSHSLFDLVAINKDYVLLIQVKSNSISKEEELKLAEFDNKPLNAKKLIWIKKGKEGWIKMIVGEL